MQKWIAILLFFAMKINAQDTFSIVGIDTITGEVGSAGASCVDLIAFGITDPSFLGDLVPGKGAINTQASYLAANQTNARTRMNLGDTPSQIISWLQANDAQSNNSVRQYGIAAIVAGAPQTAAHTGSNCLNYKNHVTGKNYSIQGNILLNQAVLDSMESKFKNTNGTLACKLMAALQGAKVVGADTRCGSNNSSSLFAFLKVSKSNDAYGAPYINIGVRTATNTFVEPIDSLQSIANGINLCSITTDITENPIGPEINIFPNPNLGSFSIYLYDLKRGQTFFDLYNCVGQNVLSGEISDNMKSVDLTGQPSGIYFLKVRNPLGSTLRKVIKN
jgi:uncharacterized Ntn-hydrolase superfamily protein